jgi:hypothetical protein
MTAGSTAHGHVLDLTGARPTNADSPLTRT